MEGMMNFKQQELAERYFQTIRTQFSDVKFLGITESPEDPSDLWVNVLSSYDEDQEIALIEFAGNITIDLLVQYGYHISLMPRRSNAHLSQQFQWQQTSSPMVS